MDLCDVYCEVGLKGDAINLSGKNQGFFDKSKAMEALEAFVKRRPYKDVEKIYMSANSKDFDPNRPPFAIEL